MIHSQKEKKRRRRFTLIIVSIITAMFICIGILIGAYLITRKEVREEFGITETAVTILLPNTAVCGG